MVTRKTTETIEEYDVDGNLLRKTTTVTEENGDQPTLDYPYDRLYGIGYPQELNTCCTDKTKGE